MQALESIRVFSRHEDFSRYILGTNGLHILGVPMGFQDFTMHFLDGVLF